MRIALSVFLLSWVNAIGFVWLRSEAAIEHLHSVPDTELAISIAPGPALLERGRHVATAIAQCQFCHGPDLGGKEIADDPFLGRLGATNLTAGKGGVGAAYRVEDWVRAIRFGVGRDGRSLALMPSTYLSRLTDRDLAAVIAYLRQVPSIDREQGGGLEAGWMTRIALAVGAAPDLLSAVEGPASTRGAEEQSNLLGEYLIDIGNCRICHHADLRGGLHPLALPGEPPPSDLRPGGAMAGWDRSDFERAMRSGLTPDGRLLDREFMPWPAYAALTDAEITALWNALSPDAPMHEPGPEASSERAFQVDRES